MTEARFFELIDILKKSRDISVDIYGQKMRITFMDFDGFDEDWCEQDREYAKLDEVLELQAYFEEICNGDYYLYGEAFGYDLCIGWDSMNI